LVGWGTIYRFPAVLTGLEESTDDTAFTVMQWNKFLKWKGEMEIP